MTTAETASPASPPLTISWRPRHYEIIFVVFACLTALLVNIYSQLPFSWRLAEIFIKNAVSLTALVYALALPVVLIRLGTQAGQQGPRSLLSTDKLLTCLQPYFSFDFLFLTLRRALATLGVIYFFLHLKHIVLLVNTANFDLFYWNLDRSLHFGVQPSVYMMENFGPNHEFSLAIDWLYKAYFKYKLIVSAIFMLELGGRKLTENYFSAYTLLWTLGGLAYLITPTDGPCFAVLTQYAVNPAELVHRFPFPVVANLSPEYVQSYLGAKIWIAKNYQELLWSARLQFLSGQSLPDMFYGIAAMPSLHVSAVTMLAVFLKRLSSLGGIIGFAYLLVIFTGSVFLQWHYAVDGYAGLALAAFVCWIYRNRA